MSTKRYIKLLPDVTCEKFDGSPLMSGNAVVTFRMLEFIWSQCEDKQFGQNNEWLYAGQAIRFAVRRDTDLPYLTLEERDWQKLVIVLNAPTAGYNPVAAYGCIPFIDNIKNAVNEVPGT